MGDACRKVALRVRRIGRAPMFRRTTEKLDEELQKSARRLAEEYPQLVLDARYEKRR